MFRFFKITCRNELFILIDLATHSLEKQFQGSWNNSWIRWLAHHRVSFSRTAGAIRKEAGVLSIERCLDQVVDGVFEHLWLLDFRAEDLVEFELFRRSTWSKLWRDKRYLRIKLVDTEVVIVVVVDPGGRTDSQDRLK